MASQAMARRVLQHRWSRLFSQAAADSHHKGGSDMWKKLFLFVGIPAIILGHVNAFIPKEGGGHHERPEFVPYEYLRMRRKKFPWGDGNHSLFHNPHTNPLPDGYEHDGH